MRPGEPSPSSPPVYTKLKELHVTTDLVRNGEAMVTVIAPRDGRYDRGAAMARAAIEKRSGVRVPIAADDSPPASPPYPGNLIVLGNRSTNSAISSLYDAFFTLLDLRYPGTGGYELRSLHNPFGDGRNVIFIGGSDDAGVAAAAEAFCRTVAQLPGDDGNLSAGRLAEIRLGSGFTFPDDMREVHMWEGSRSWGAAGYFGWNSISKRMALYYMTGDPVHAHEFLRLAFPDEAAKRRIADVDGELIENKDDPLAGPYHYGAPMLILFWDLIEESPVFTDADRLRITNAFSRQLAHPQERGWRAEVYGRFGRGSSAFPAPPERVGDRHELWSHVSLFVLSRYFQTHYPHTLWRHLLDGTRWYFSPLHRHAWARGLYESPAIYATTIAPILTYVILSGDREAVEKGVISQLLLGQEILTAGGTSDPQLSIAAIDFFHKAAYLTGDGRFLEYLQRTGIDLNGPRVGQSFWPGPELRPRPPKDLVGRWTNLPMPEPMSAACAPGQRPEESFVFGSFRNTMDDDGDYALYETYKVPLYGAYHTFSISALRLNGRIVLAGTQNQVFTRMDGMAPPRVSVSSAVHASYVLGGVAVLQGEARDAGFAAWRRTLAIGVLDCALVVDRLSFTSSSDHTEVELLWQGPGEWSPLRTVGGLRIRHDDTLTEIRSSDDLDTSVPEGVSGSMVWRGAVCEGEALTLFSLIASAERGGIACRRLGDEAAVLRLPGPAVVVAGSHGGTVGELVFVAADRVHGKSVRSVDAGVRLFETNGRVDLDWRLGAGVMEAVAHEDVQLICAVHPNAELTLDGVPHCADALGDRITVSLAAGGHTVCGLRPEARALDSLRVFLDEQMDAVRENADSRETPSSPGAQPRIAALHHLGGIDIGAPAAHLLSLPTPNGGSVCAAENERIHLWTPSTGERRTLTADAPVQAIRWWPEERLLLVGDRDGRLIAFEPRTGLRRWTFQSQMDPAVWRAAKPYWFHTAKGHEGIHGLHTGAFFDGATQAFVGSACTLEILAGDGQLIRRLPVFWGPGKVFCLVERSDGSTDLLVGRQPADTHAVVVVNSHAEYTPNMLGPDPRSFHDVPPDHTDVWTWGRMARSHMYCEDINGDGEKEVIGDIHGAWNRVTVWSSDATPLHCAHFGPGPNERLGVRTIRGLELADPDASGRRAIVVATAGGWVVALDCTCRKIWSCRLAAAPVALRVLGGIRTTVACDAGAVHVLDQFGTLTHSAQVAGIPDCMERCADGVVVGTENGTLEFLTVP